MVKELRRYTLLLMYTMSISENELKKEIEEMEKLINSLGGSVDFNKYLGMKKLAYEIKRQNTAYLVQFYFNLNDNLDLGKNIKELNRKIGLNNNIIRDVLIRVEHDEVNSKNLENFKGLEIFN